ncbi:zinc finger protein 345-like isoform X2 [Ambystoma mexicanum]
MEEAVKLFTNFDYNTCGKSAPLRQNIESTFVKLLQDHNYYCASSPKALKLALDDSMHMEQKLCNKLGNLVKLQKRLTERVSQLLRQLRKSGFSDHANLQQLHLEGRSRSIYVEANQVFPIELDPNETSGKDQEDVFSVSEFGKASKQRGIFQRKCRSTAQNVISQSTEHEQNHALKQSTKQPMIHTAEDAEKCSECGSDVISNPKTRTGKQMLTYSDSSNTCRQSSAIPRRQWRPTGEKLYVCGGCGKGFSMLASLIVHQRVHIKEKQYPCIKCGQSFSQSSSLTRHETVSNFPEENSETTLMDYPNSEGEHATNSHTVMTPEVPSSMNKEGVTYLMDLQDFDGTESLSRIADYPGVKAVFLVCVNPDGKETFIQMKPELGSETFNVDPNILSMLSTNLNLDTEIQFIKDIDSLATSADDQTTSKGNDGLPITCSREIVCKAVGLLGKPPLAEAQLTVFQNPVQGIPGESQLWEESNPELGGEKSQWGSGVINSKYSNLHHGFPQRDLSNKCDNYASNLGNVKLNSRKLNFLKNGRSYSCTECETTFNKKSLLTVHLRTHFGKKTYQCTKCEKSFLENSVLNTHLRSHFGEAPYQCTRCEKRFRKKSILSRHLRMHMEVGPNPCTEFKKRFVLGSTLAQCPRNAGERTHQCTECERGFMLKSQLIRHYAFHTGGMFICKVCKKCFNQRELLTVHQRKCKSMRRRTMKVINPLGPLGHMRKTYLLHSP